MILLEAISEKTLLVVQDCDYSAGHLTPSDPGMLQVGWPSKYRWSRNAITQHGAPVPYVISIGIVCGLKPLVGKAETNMGVFAVRR